MNPTRPRARWSGPSTARRAGCSSSRTSSRPGFDQKKLVALYVDKPLGNAIEIVQTYSRVNRTCAGKDKVFVVDFVNDAETVLSAFRTYDRGATMNAAQDPERGLRAQGSPRRRRRATPRATSRGFQGRALQVQGRRRRPAPSDAYRTRRSTPPWRGRPSSSAPGSWRRRTPTRPGSRCASERRRRPGDSEQAERAQEAAAGRGGRRR